MSANPPTPAAGPVRWYESQKFKAYVLALGLAFGGWLLQGVTTGGWEWRSLAVSAIGTFLLLLKDWAGVEVISPFPVQNRKIAAGAGS